MIIFIIGGAVMLGVCIFIHELGHYVLGRAVGVRVKTFSIGFGKGIWKKQVGETTYQITAIPLGGFVRFYGDDYTSNEKVPGGFLSTPPLKRIIPVLGGPLFNLFLAIFIFLVLNLISGPPAPVVQVWEELGNDSPAYQAGLRNGDEILEINGSEVRTFFDVQSEVTLSSGAILDFTVLRNGEEKTFAVNPTVDGSGRAAVGIRMPGERSLEVSYPFSDLWSYRFRRIFGDERTPPGLRAMPYLNNGDIIQTVNGQEIESVYQLQRLLGNIESDTVEVKVERRTMSWLAPWFTKEMTVAVPVQEELRLMITGIVDQKYGGTVPDQMLMSNVADHQKNLASLKINGEPPGSFERLYARYGRKPQTALPRVTDLSAATEATSENDEPVGETVRIEIEDRVYRASVYVEKIGLMGFRPGSMVDTQYLDRHESFLGVLSGTYQQTTQNIMIYPQFFQRLFSGHISFIDNAMGPVGMFAVAGIVMKSGLIDYLQLMAAISVALMVMNLLPFPMVDGGHIMFFLYEAIAGKPVSPAVFEIVHRIAFILLLSLGLFIMYGDVLFLIGL